MSYYYYYQEKEAKKQISLQQIANLEKQMEAIAAEKDAHIADLLQQLEVARAVLKQAPTQQQNQPTVSMLLDNRQSQGLVHLTTTLEMERQLAFLQKERTLNPVHHLKRWAWV